MIPATALSTALTLDLTVTAPLLYWRFRGRRGALRIFVLGLLVAGLFLHNPLLSALRTWVSPVAEAVVIGLLIRGFYRARRTGTAAGGDFLTRGRSILGQALGSDKMGDIMIGEMAVFYYLLAAGRRTQDGFSYHKRNGIRSILYLFLFCIVAETTGVHFLVGMFSRTAAWVLTGLGIYTLLQVLAHIRAIRTRPVAVEDGWLHLRNGLVSDASIRLDDIIELRIAVKKEGGLRLGLLYSFEKPNLVIETAHPVTVYKPFGIRRQSSKLLFCLDEPDKLLDLLQRH